MLVVLLLILAVILALGISIFASQNPSSVNLAIAAWRLENVPLYLVVLVSLLIGLIVAWIFGLLNSISSSITIFGKDLKIKREHQEVNQLHKKLENLEAENSDLKNRLKTTNTRPTIKPSF